MSAWTSRITRDSSGRAGIRLLMGVSVGALLLPLVSSPSGALTFSNTTPIIVPGTPPPPGCPSFPAPNNSCPPTPAAPYPSMITTSGLSGTVTDVNVTLYGFTTPTPTQHDLKAPDYFDVMLEAPNGQTVMLMSDVCDVVGPQAPTDLTFDDAAATPIPEDSLCVTGTYQPFDDEGDPNFLFTGVDFFNAPAPVTTNNILLSSINGSNPNGIWRLWVVDDTPADVGPDGGQFAGGWSIDITVSAPPTTTTTSTTSTTMPTTTTTTMPPHDHHHHDHHHAAARHHHAPAGRADLSRPATVTAGPTP